MPEENGNSESGFDVRSPGMRHVANREKAGDRGRILMLILPATRRVMLALPAGSASQFWTHLSQGAVIAISSKQLIIFMNMNSLTIE